MPTKTFWGCALALSQLLVGFLQVVSGGEEATYATDRVLVMYKTGPMHGQGLWGITADSLYDEENVVDAIDRLGQEDDLVLVEPDFAVQIALEPNDTKWHLQWGMRRVGAAGAWNHSIQHSTTGSSQAGRVTVCVIDTGIDYNHLELQHNIHPLVGYNALNDSDDPYDDSLSGHGTHCAGTIGCAGNNGMGVAGVNWSVDLLACKAFNSAGVGYVSSIIDCLDFCMRNNATISSNSYAMSANLTSSILMDAIAQAGAQGHLFVAAAGNEAIDLDSEDAKVFPAGFALDNMLTVAATEHTAAEDGSGLADRLAHFSNWGASTVHLAAPGTRILSTFPGNWLAYMSGTSVSAPFVAGAAALLKGLSGGTLSSAGIREILMRTTQPVQALAGRTCTGGMLDLAAAAEVVVNLQKVSLPRLPLNQATTALATAFLSFPMPADVSASVGAPTGTWGPYDGPAASPPAAGEPAPARLEPAPVTSAEDAGLPSGEPTDRQLPGAFAASPAVLLGGAPEPLQPPAQSAVGGSPEHRSLTHYTCTSDIRLKIHLVS